MKSIAPLFLVLVLTSCAPLEPASTTLTDGSIVHTLRCNAGWPECYRSAQALCGENGFIEIDRSEDGKVSSAGRLEPLHSIHGGIENQAYSENPRNEVFDRVLTIRCDSPGR